jgi:DNA-binding HxlR family transcriptional regulator
MTNIEKTIKYCPIELSLDLITKKWVIQLVRDMLFGKTHFNEFKENKDITNKVLSRCLKQMEEDKLITKTVDGKNTEYHLTSKGKALNKVVYELAMYTVNTDEYNQYYSEESKEKIRNLFKEKLDL